MLNRYSRQMLLLGGNSAQTQLSQSSVCIIGAGGIGSTVIYYLAGAGIGKITIIDHDIVDETNLHRQIIHDTSTIGMKKAQSAAKRIRLLNPNIEVLTIEEKITSDNVMTYLKGYDIIIDATDNIHARYIINDACIFLSIPLVSGSAIGFEGQITVLCTPQGPCYRCLYPSPSITESCRSCVNAGVLGPIPGLIGCIQATETIKLILLKKQHEVVNTNNSNNNSNTLLYSCLIGKQMYYDGMSGETSTYDLPHKNLHCIICGDHKHRILHTIQDSQAFLARFDKLVSEQSKLPLIPVKNRITMLEFSEILKNNQEENNSTQQHLIIDVRSKIQYNMLVLPIDTINTINTNTNIKMVNIPLNELNQDSIHHLFVSQQYNKDNNIEEMNQSIKQPKQSPPPIIYVLCRRGNDSIRATHLLLQWGIAEFVYNIDGGIQAWKDEIDPTFSIY